MTQKQNEEMQGLTWKGWLLQGVMFISFLGVIALLLDASLVKGYCIARDAIIKVMPINEMYYINTPKHYSKNKEDVMKWVLDQWDVTGRRDEINAIITCESNWNVDTFHVNNNGSVDLGLYQWNTIHIKSGLISIECAGNYRCATKKAIELYKVNKFRPWVCSKILGIK